MYKDSRGLIRRPFAETDEPIPKIEQRIRQDPRYGQYLQLKAWNRLTYIQHETDKLQQEYNKVYKLYDHLRHVLDRHGNIDRIKKKNGLPIKEKPLQLDLQQLPPKPKDHDYPHDHDTPT